MSTALRPRRRVVDIAVPNGSDRRVDVTLAIRAIPARELARLNLGLPRRTALRVAGFGLHAGNPCRLPRVGTAPKQLTVTLEPYDTVTVRAIIDTLEGPRGGAAAFAVTDVRGGQVVGGATIVCANPLPAGARPPAPDPTDPCPLVPVDDAYVIDPDGDPGVRGTPLVVPAGRPVEIVVPIANPAAVHLHEARAWLEHLGGSGVAFTPRTWTLGEMEAGAGFWPTWPVDATGATPGRHEGSIVVVDADHAHMRHHFSFVVPGRDERH
jgi:hypothetical protein